MQGQLQSIFAEVLNLPTDMVGVNQSCLELGGDSITAMQVVAKWRASGINMTVQHILQSITIAQLAASVSTMNRFSILEDEILDQEFGVSPIQRIYFKSADMTKSDGSRHFNQSFLLRLTKHTTAQTLGWAVQAVAGRHSMLRARFTQAEDGTWR